MDSYNQVWQDKISFSQGLITKELDMIRDTTACIDLVKNFQYSKDRLAKESAFRSAWANAYNLYSVLRHDYENTLSKEEQEKLKRNMNEFVDLRIQQDLFKLIETKELIVKLLSINGFHDLVRRNEIPEELGEF